MSNICQMLTSMEVAQMVGKEHKELLRDIRRYCGQLGESKIALTDFFTESTYITEQNKTMPCFLVTKKGCEFIAHKLTGQKGTEFTAKYINRFHEMQSLLESESAKREIAEVRKEMREQRKILNDLLSGRNHLARISSRPSTRNEAYISEIMKTIENSMDTEYLMGVYTFAVTYPDKSKCAV